jgi:RNA polymerase sigma-70 factor (ECF subfamily)
MDPGFHDELTLDSYEEDRSAPDREKSHILVAETFDEIFQCYHSMVFNLTLRILGDREEALDVSQEVFFAVFRKLHRFRGESSLKTWIYRIAINRASNRCRWWKRFRRSGTVSLDDHLNRDDDRTLLDSLESAGNTPEEALMLQEKHLEIERSLLRLPIQQRVVVVMRDIQGLSYEEIAESLQVSLGTVKSRIARGREELKSRLNGALG